MQTFDKNRFKLQFVVVETNFEIKPTWTMNHRCALQLDSNRLHLASSVWPRICASAFRCIPRVLPQFPLRPPPVSTRLPPPLQCPTSNCLPSHSTIQVWIIHRRFCWELNFNSGSNDFPLHRAGQGCVHIHFLFLLRKKTKLGISKKFDFVFLSIFFSFFFFHSPCRFFSSSTLA